MKRVAWRGRKAVALMAIVMGMLFSGGSPAVAQQGEQGGGLTLEQVLGMALGRNRDLHVARLDLESAEGRVKEAWGNVFPTLDLTANYTRNLSVPANFLPRVIFDPDANPDELIAVKFGADNAWNFQLRAEQPLFEASAFVGVGAAGRYESLQTEVVRGRTIDVVTRVKLAYYEALLAQEAVRLSENTVARVRKTLGETRKMFEAGLSSSYDVLRLEVELANLEPQLRRSQNAALAARRQLGVELNIEQLDSVRVAGSLFDLDLQANGEVGGATARLVRDGEVSRVDAEQAVTVALERRSDLRQLELTEQLRQTELRVEQSEYLPKVSLFGTYSIAAQENGSLNFFGATGAERSYGRQVGIQVSVPLFSGFQRPARTAQIRATISSVQTQYALARDQAEAEVKSLLEQTDEARDRSAAQRLALRQAERGYEIARAQYREGIGSQLEITDAEVALRQSEFNYVEAVYDYLVSQARLDQAMGMVPELQGNGNLAAAEARRP
jgi:outer membrane protein TolC